MFDSFVLVVSDLPPPPRSGASRRARVDWQLGAHPRGAPPGARGRRPHSIACVDFFQWCTTVSYYLRVVRPRTRAAARQLCDVSGAPMAVSVAILYAGRWFGRAGQHLEEDIPGNDTPNALRASWRWCLQTSGAPPPLAPMMSPASQPRRPRCSVQAGRRTPRLLALERLLRAAQRAAQRAAVDAGGKAGRAIVRDSTRCCSPCGSSDGQGRGGPPPLRADARHEGVCSARTTRVQ